MTKKEITAARVRWAAGKNPLLKYVAEWIVERANDGYNGNFSGPLRDLFYGGCSSGMVSELVYYKDTVPFAKKYNRQIFNLAIRAADDYGDCDNVFAYLTKCNGVNDIGTVDQMWNFLAWWGFQRAAEVIADRIGYDG